MQTLAEFVKIWLLCICASVLYGILHDQVTVRVSLEYFTVGHPPVFDTTSLTLLAFGWGVIATWWVGALLGFPTSMVALAGRREKLVAHDLVRPIGVLFAVAAGAAMLFGMIGFVLAVAGWVNLPQKDIILLPSGGDLGYIAASWAHHTSYATGVVGGVVLWIWLWHRRKHMSQTPASIPSQIRFVRGVVISGVLCAIVWGFGLYLGYITYQGFTDTYFPVNGFLMDPRLS
ncbi:MAG: hypothetical protein GFH27_549319n22 [Chloroflexi bacterium AL-W]|nr:hypothetical protein [Chloroflexi bacterium AL-N1]NOK70568.1 hypothetical protein [Chloroflexi bacterium AL-N10]NOK77560.1 hypothetical protein [Chloroflexi bacterium AL-N5]NOK84411.1 hypothetical protein [Chloroflexi bacterium AL-W]NOK92300.1 hypothetical protein [Chloroflexi bacterium AL-N15]